MGYPYISQKLEKCFRYYLTRLQAYGDGDFKTNRLRHNIKLRNGTKKSRTIRIIMCLEAQTTFTVLAHYKHVLICLERLDARTNLDDAFQVLAKRITTRTREIQL